MNENLGSLTSTKFIMSAACLVIVTVAFFTGRLEESTFMPFLLGILSQYGLFNTASKFADKTSAN
jgi:hypothetical protein